MELQTTQPSELIILTPGQMKNLVSQIIEETKNHPKPEKEEQIYLTSKEVQKFLNIGHSTMHRFINEGKLSPVRFGRKLLFKKSDLIIESGFKSK
ncbi:MAG: helix-turn-helix domain-containing protein [Ignavibacterium sp.]|nr:helix-turn-helix domain-containing protein [Ignavibacterium sp.]